MHYQLMVTDASSLHSEMVLLATAEGASVARKHGVLPKS